MKFRIICLCILIISCKQERSKSASEQIGIELGAVDSRLAEASGLVASVANPGFFWTINDSGNPAEVFLIDQHATIRLVCTLANIKNRDWEDIAIDLAHSGKNYLYVADIGDNSLQYENKIVYRFEEPVLSKGEEIIINNFETFVLNMPDGKRDAETILIDPKTHDLFMISKGRDNSDLYVAPNPLSTGTMTFQKILSMPFRQIVAGSISSDGQKVLLKNYSSIYLWERTGTESLSQLFTKEPKNVPYQREQQGEAIAWSRDGTQFYTLSESTFGRKASLIVHQKNDSSSSNFFLKSSILIIK
jgi:hypothetical protein